LASSFTEAYGVNSAGQIVGLYNNATGFHGFLEIAVPNPPPPAGTTADMILRHGADGQYQIYDIGSNSLLAAYQLGTVGNVSSGGLEVYDIANNQITGAAFVGTVGLDWQFSGVGNFSGNPDETDLLLRNVKTGGLEVYDINNNQITGAAFIGRVGLDWHFAGIAPIDAAGTSDLVLRNVNSGAFEVYDIAGNTLVGAASLGAVGLDWQLGGFAADPPSAPAGGSDGSTSQLVQAMAGFGGDSGADDALSTVALGADTSQQMLLTAPQHA
jgi:hypothetical protein